MSALYLWWFDDNPWAYLTSEEEDRPVREEAEHSEGTCEECGGMHGDGWSMCACEPEDEE